MSSHRILLLSDLHYCQDEYGGIPRDEKARRIRELIHEEHKKDPVSMILFLGDYSLDHWAWNIKGSWLTEGKSYTADFVELVCRDLPAPYYMLPGNHEQYGPELWKKLTGFDRSAHFLLGGYLFILWDSYGADLDPTEHSDGTYTPIDVAAVRALMQQHPGVPVILCSHAFYPNLSEEEAALIRDERIVCLFQGHTHYSEIRTLPAEYGGKKLVQTGGWASTTSNGGCPWGLRELYLEEDRIRTGYIVPTQQLMSKGRPYTVAGRYQDAIEIPVRR